MILLWGLPHDPPLRALADALHELDAPAFVLDQGRSDETNLELEIGDAVDGYFGIGEETFPFGSVTAAYIRPHGPDERRLSASERQADQALCDALLLWAEIADSALVLNRPSAMAANGSKPYQLARIAAAGFAIPPTLVTTDPREARAFAAQHGELVYKSASGVRSIVSRLDPEAEDRLDDIRWCPTLFQRHVPGVDYRVHVVGDSVFTTTIESNADDYRYPRNGDAPTMRAERLPDEIERSCRQLVAASGLILAGIDLRRTPEGGWYCFEVNPSPAFTFFEEHSGQPISAAVARVLTAGAVSPGASRGR